MARKPAEIADDATLPIVSGRKTKTTNQRLIDPQAPLPGAMKRVGPNLAKRSPEKKADPKHLRDRYALYCRLLAENYGNPAPALAEVFDISIEEAQLRQVELHTEITRAMQGVSTRELFTMNQMSKEHRLMHLRSLMYHPNPAVSLKAMDMLNELDGATKSSGDTWEEWIGLALGRKGV